VVQANPVTDLHSRPQYPLEDLTRAVADSYEVFSRYTIGSTLDVCRCNVCMDAETEKSLVKTPLREIPASGLCEFTNSAHGEGRAEEVKYFLPRFFEVMAAGEACSWTDSMLSLEQLRHWDWRAWDSTEVEVIERFAVTFFWAVLIHPEHFRLYPLNDLMILLSRIRVDILPLIRNVVQIADKRDLTRIFALWEQVKGDSLSNQFWSDTPEPARAVVGYLSSTEALEAGMRALEMPDFPELNEELTAGLSFFFATTSST
jgi:hypothetical protein